MAAARRNEQGQLERLLTKGDFGWRTVIVVLIALNYPEARALLGLPARPENNQIAYDVSSIRKDVELVKADILDIRGKASRVEATLSGFQIDFDRYKRQNP